MISVELSVEAIEALLGAIILAGPLGSPPQGALADAEFALDSALLEHEIRTTRNQLLGA